MILFKEESYKIIGAALKVYNTLGHGFLESVYHKALQIEFDQANIPYDHERDIKIVIRELN